MKHFRSKSFHITWVLAIAFAGAALFYIEQHYNAPLADYPITQSKTQIIEPRGSQPAKITPSPTSYKLPATFLLHVPFTPQAPTANWDELHNEACEEVSVIMTQQYFAGDQRAILPPEEVEEQISKLTEWEDNHFGYHLDVNSQETAQLLENFYGLKTKILTDYNQDTIKQELAKKHLVLLPANGKLLGNPNFRSPGPPYHMLVIKGYNSNLFITNDPGTRKGQSYPYSFSTLYKANGNFDHATHSVNLNEKNIIVVWK